MPPTTPECVYVVRQRLPKVAGRAPDAPRGGGLFETRRVDADPVVPQPDVGLGSVCIVAVYTHA
jgi:hypothetical protein